MNPAAGDSVRAACTTNFNWTETGPKTQVRHQSWGRWRAASRAAFWGAIVSVCVSCAA
jgi:hypothetical protein